MIAASNKIVLNHQRSLLALLVVALLIHLDLVISDSSNGNKLSRLLSEDEFSIRATVSTIRDRHSEGYEEKFSIEEQYSNSKRSARLKINQLKVDEEDANQEEQSTFHYIATGKQLVHLYKNPSSYQIQCDLSNAKKLIDTIFGSIVSFDERIAVNEWMLLDEGLPEYVIGVARLLLFVEANKNKLQLNSNNNNDGDLVIRNIKTISYKLDTKLGTKGSNKGNTLVVYYGSTESHSVAGDGIPDIPLRIRLLLPAGAEISIDFTFIEHMSNEPMSINSDISHLYLPLGVGCASKLVPIDPFSGLVPPRIASFRASFKRLLYEEEGRHLGDFYVAYDGSIETLRVDTVDDHHLMRAKQSITIYEFKDNRKYHILQELNEDSSRLKSDRNESIILVNDARSDCVAAKIRVDDVAENLIEPLIPFAQMVEMGSSKVRGIEVRVFEHNTTRLPLYLFPQGAFFDADGKAHSLHTITYKSLKGELPDYSVIYYFSRTVHSDSSSASTGNPPAVGPLLRIDLLKNGFPVVRAEIFDFVWQLTDAPNGDPQDELFSLRDRCSGAGSNLIDRYAMMSLSLNHTETTSVRTPEIDSLIAHLMHRNKAFSRALIQNTDLKATQLYDLESKVHIQHQDIQIRAALKIQNHNHQLFEATVVATAQLQRKQPGIPMLNFEECFWEAAHRRSRGYLLFSFCFNSCYIDEEPNQVKNESQLFLVRPGVNLPCQVMQVNTNKSVIKSLNTLSTDLYKQLHALKLPLEVQGTKVTFDVAQVELKTEKGSPIEVDTKSDSHSDLYDDPILDGLGFITDVGATKISPKLPATLMNLNLCESSCLANMSCSSFSICLSSERVECLHSDFEFKDPKLIELIRTKLNENNQSNGSTRRKGSIALEIPYGVYGEQQQDVSDSEKRQLKLRVEPRCRIYNKYALEMFKSARKLFVPVNKNKMTPVDSAAQCAKMCLRTNVKFLKKLAKLKSNLISQEGTSISDYWLQAFEFLNRNASSWCDTIKFRDLNNPPLTDTIRQHLDPELLAKNGICTYSGPNWIAKVSGSGSETNDPNGSSSKMVTPSLPTMIRMQSYNLIYTLLYERQYGIQLIPLDYPDGSVVGGNHQVVSAKAEVEDCARLCFSQAIGLKPWCKSFEWVQDASSGFDNKRTYCLFNSITAAEAYLASKPEQLITSKIDANLKVWHYEPKNSFSYDHLVLKELLKITNSQQQQFSLTETRLQTIGIMFVLTLSLCTGLFFGYQIGMKLSRHIGDRRESVSNPSRSFLNGLGGSQLNELSSTDLSYKKFEADLYLPELPELS